MSLCVGMRAMKILSASGRGSKKNASVSRILPDRILPRPKTARTAVARRSSATALPERWTAKMALEDQQTCQCRERPAEDSWVSNLTQGNITVFSSNALYFFA
ncbi:hypothetical protein CEXT_619821 [Caerostris extrusa]|uniref:Uncharacterized protein n=1 Tax=Caerostris extrusa TaxID=172846 RepID=A0AAV4R3V8_CAEEX|nr:hypothetical protein CEXT_619821 [Caerostris extrusa]